MKRLLWLTLLLVPLGIPLAAAQDEPIIPVFSIAGPREIGRQLEFDATPSEGVDLAYRFDFGDGVSSGLITSPVVVHTYETAGLYVITLEVVDRGQDNQSRFSSDEIEIIGPLETAEDEEQSSPVRSGLILGIGLFLLFDVVLAIFVIRRRGREKEVVQSHSFKCNVCRAELAADAVICENCQTPVGQGGLDIGSRIEAEEADADAQTLDILKEPTIALPTDEDEDGPAKDCRHCGYALPTAALECPGCGRPTREQKKVQKKKRLKKSPEVAAAPSVKRKRKKVADPSSEEEYAECPECEAMISVDSTSCPLCGVELELVDEGEEDPVYTSGRCPNCYRAVGDADEQCAECGETLEPSIGEMRTMVKPAEGPPVETAPCPSCGKSIPLDSKVCSHCGEELELDEEEIEMGECPGCQDLIPIDSASCPNCGIELIVEAPRMSEPTYADDPYASPDYLLQAECPTCHNMISATSEKCPHCGTEFEQNV